MPTGDLESQPRAATRRGAPAVAALVIALSSFLILLAKVALHLSASAALDWVSVPALVALAPVALVALSRPSPGRARTIVTCLLGAGVCFWFADVEVTHLEPGAAHRGDRLLVDAAAVTASVALWTTALLVWKRRRVAAPPL